MAEDTYGEEEDIRRKENEIVPTGGGEASRPENLKDLYASVL